MLSFIKLVLKWVDMYKKRNLGRIIAREYSNTTPNSFTPKMVSNIRSFFLPGGVTL